MDKRARSKKEAELHKLNIWHVAMQVPHILPGNLRRICLAGIEAGSGPVNYYKSVLKNNARYHQLCVELDGDG